MLEARWLGTSADCCLDSLKAAGVGILGSAFSI